MASGLMSVGMGIGLLTGNPFYMLAGALIGTGLDFVAMGLLFRRGALEKGAE